MKGYYFVTSLLPPLQIGLPVDLSFFELSRMFATNLRPADQEKVQVIRRLYDLENLRFYWREEPLSDYGNLTEKDLEEAIASQIGLPDYVYDFMERFESVEDRLHNFPKLISRYYQEEIENASGFLERFLEFERDLRLIGVGFRASHVGRDVSVELQYEDPTDTVVAQILAQKDAASFEPPYRYEDIKPIFDDKRDDPIALHQALNEYRFAKYEEFYEGEIFSIDRILAYIAQLILAEEWLALDKKSGTEMIDSMVKELR